MNRIIYTAAQYDKGILLNLEQVVSTITPAKSEIEINEHFDNYNVMIKHSYH